MATATTTTATTTATTATATPTVLPCVAVVNSTGVICDAYGYCKTNVEPGSLCFYGGYKPDVCSPHCFAPSQMDPWIRTPDTVGCQVSPQIYTLGKLFPLLAAVAAAYLVVNAAVFVAAPFVRRARRARTAPGTAALTPLSALVLRELPGFFTIALLADVALALFAVYTRQYSVEFAYSLCRLYEEPSILMYAVFGGLLLVVPLTAPFYVLVSDLFGLLWRADGKSADVDAFVAAWEAFVRNQCETGRLQKRRDATSGLIWRKQPLPGRHLGGNGAHTDVPIALEAFGGDAATAPYTVELDILEGRLPSSLTVIRITAFLPDGSVAEEEKILLGTSASQWIWRIANVLSQWVLLRYVFEAVVRMRWTRVEAAVRYR
ncbi:hypothetical protein DFJ73DRAFT_773463 [Zopfochytrium polystomum]|nr:hypothetical protein DFJ73DRAFT_773463 [Zopfochytrium polystomum]